MVMVTISYFGNPTLPPPVDNQNQPLWPASGGAPGTSFVEELVVHTLTKAKFVDILSPQLYRNNCNDPTWTGLLGGGDWSGLTTTQRNAYKNADNVIAPSINTSGTKADWTSYKNTWASLLVAAPFVAPTPPATPFLPPPAGFLSFCLTYTCSPSAPCGGT